MSDLITVGLDDGRDLEVRVSGPADGVPLVYHHGTPQAAWPFPLLEDAAEALGLRVVCFSRPGYAASTPLTAWRPIAADVADTVAVLDHLGHDTFLALGWSGGGPRSLACAALLPQRCLAAASGVGVAPHVGFPGDFLAGMGEENVEEFGAAFRGEEPLRELLEQWRPEFAAITGPTLADGMGDLLPDADRAVLTEDFAEEMAATFRHALSTGIEGWLHDDLAFVAYWGFEVSDITTPVALWQGRQDRMVPFTHAEFLAAAIPGARVHFTEGDGHLSLMTRMPEILADLMELGGLPVPSAS